MANKTGVWVCRSSDQKKLFYTEGPIPEATLKEFSALGYVCMPGAYRDNREVVPPSELPIVSPKNEQVPHSGIIKAIVGFQGTFGLFAFFGVILFGFLLSIEVTQHLSHEWQVVFWLLVLGGLFAHFKLTMK